LIAFKVDVLLAAVPGGIPAKQDSQDACHPRKLSKGRNRSPSGGRTGPMELCENPSRDKSDWQGGTRSLIAAFESRQTPSWQNHLLVYAVGCDRLVSASIRGMFSLAGYG
jgi:hypothetical protein